MIFTIVNPPTNGSLTAITQLSPTTVQVTYTPNGNFNGSDSFTYKANDGQADSNIATVSITVAPVNDAPRFDAVADQPPVNEDAPLQNVSITGVSPGGGADEAGQPVGLTASSSNPAIVPHPIITGTGATRTLSYQPAANANGTVTIMVTANDGQTENNTFSQTFTIAVAPVVDVISVNPNVLPQDARGQTLTIMGDDFGSNASATFSGTGITVGSVAVQNPTKLTTTVTITLNAPTGPRDVTVSSAR